MTIQPWQKKKKKKALTAASRTEAEIAARKAAKKSKVEIDTTSDDARSTKASAEPAPPARLIAHYREKVVPALAGKTGC